MKLDSIGQDTLTRLGVCVVVSVALLYGAEALLDGKSIPLWEKYGPWLKDNKVQAIAIAAAVLYGASLALWPQEGKGEVPGEEEFTPCV